MHILKYKHGRRQLDGKKGLWKRGSWATTAKIFPIFATPNMDQAGANWKSAHYQSSGDC